MIGPNYYDKTTIIGKSLLFKGYSAFISAKLT